MTAPSTAHALSPITSAPAMLDVRGIGISFGGLTAAKDFSLALPQNGLYGLIGPNGAE